MEKTKVLIVDGEPQCPRVVQSILENTGHYEVKFTRAPADALAAARELMPDVAVLAVDLHGRDGRELADEIRAGTGLCGLPIVFLTRSLPLEAAAPSPRERMLPKPVTPLSLVFALKELLAEAAGLPILARSA